MQKYEMVREIFNTCDNSRMRDVDIKEIETDDVDSVASQYFSGKNVKWSKLDQGNGTIVFDIDADGLGQRVTFTQI